MGYNSEIEFNVKVIKNKISECRQFIEKRIRELPEGYVLWHLINITDVDKDGHIKFDEKYCKWYHETDFLLEFLPFLEDGKVIFRGEDGDIWGYEILNGILFNLEIAYMRGEEIKGVLQ